MNEEMKSKIPMETYVILDQLKLLFGHYKLISICLSCKHYDKYWYLDKESLCNNCAMKDDGIWFEEGSQSNERFGI